MINRDKDEKARKDKYMKQLRISRTTMKILRQFNMDLSAVSKQHFLAV